MSWQENSRLWGEWYWREESNEKQEERKKGRKEGVRGA